MRREAKGKLGGYQQNGGQAWDVDPSEQVLYLGAAQGSTASWMSTQLDEGQIVAVEKSPVAGLGLLRAAREQACLVPVIGDARCPETYAPLAQGVDVIYQDVAQKDQVEILLKNVDAFRPRRAFLALKTRSIAVERDPEDVATEAAERLGEAGSIVEVVSLDPIHKDHAMIVVDFPR